MKKSKLLKLFQKGTITLDEYRSKLEEYKRKNGEIIDLDIAFEDKLEKEFIDYCNRLLKKDKNTIINSAYEKIVKEEIKDELKNMDLHDKEKECMLLQEDLLNEFYHDWLDCDTPLGESLRDNLQESIAVLTRYYKNKNNETKGR